MLLRQSSSKQPRASGNRAHTSQRETLQITQLHFGQKYQMLFSRLPKRSTDDIIGHMHSEQKIGLFGGSFNPIHNGHLAMANDAARVFALDLILFMVAKDPPHKEIADDVDAKTRFEMVRLALEGYNNFTASDMELKREGKSYTFDTVAELKKEYPHAQLYLIIGADMLHSLMNWHRPLELLQSVEIIAVSRPGIIGNMHSEKERLENAGGIVHIAPFAGESISSSMVRQCVYDAQPIDRLVPRSVEENIYMHALYAPASIRAMQTELKETLSSKRYRHSVGTMREAIRLAKQYSADAQKARIAALLHDCAKFEAETQRDLALFHVLTLDEYEEASPGLLHDRLGEILAREAFQVYDEDILSAIRHHTLCKPNMTDLEKVVYLADKIEPNREDEKVGYIREEAKSNLNRAVLMCMERSLEHTKRTGKRPKPETARARDALLLEIENSNKLQKKEEIKI